jgi:WD40 repeat protein/mono/diheme cytochrome c family protein
MFIPARWIRNIAVLLSLFILAGSTGAQTTDRALTERAWGILKTHCSRCHSSNGKAKGGFDYILDRERLVARHQIIPGKAAESPVWQRIQQAEMPPPGKQQTPVNAEDLAALQKWIAAGAPGLTSTTVAITPPEAVPELILADLQNQEPRQRRFLRYFTLTHLAAARIAPEDLQRHRHALAKLTNSMSWHPRITRPTAIDPAETIYRIDLRDYRWTARQWDRLTATYPYRLKEPTALEQKLAGLAGSDIVLVRGDWFVATASRPPFYHDFLQLPASDRALERLLNIEVLANLQDDNAVRAGFNGSGVARSNRIIERHDGGHGAYWRSYDFTENIGRQNIFEHPLGPGAGSNAFQQAGGEIIFNLPNGFQAYLLVDGRGQRVDKAPGEIVSDPKRPDRLVENGLSCMSCHIRGMLPKDDQVRAHVSKNAGAFSGEDRAAVKALYAPSARFKALMAEDVKRFTDALARAGVPETEPEPVEAVALRYEAVLDLTTAAAEMGLSAGDFADRLRRSPLLSRPLGALLARGGTLQRQLFQESFADLARVVSVETVVKQETVKPGSFAGHRGAVRGLAFGPGNKRVATGGEDGTVRVWDSATGREELLLNGHREEVTAVAISGDGRILLSGGRDRTLRVWDLQTGRELHLLRGHTDAVRSVAVSADGKLALSGGDDRSVRLWDLQRGQELRAWAGHGASVTSVALSADGKRALSGSLDRTVRLWDVNGGALGTWEGHQGAVYSVSFSPDGQRALSGGNDRVVRLWDVRAGKEVKRFTGHVNAVVSVAFTPDGKRGLSASSQYQTRDRILRVWDLDQGAELAGRQSEGDERVESVSFGPDGKQALVSDAVGGVRLWSAPGQASRGTSSP